jgi:hypothetical protein
MVRLGFLFLAVSLICVAFQAEAADIGFSGYGTIGYAQSDKPYHYQRFIDNGGTFDRDSLFGVQMDAKFTPEWGGTVQAKLAPSDSSDNRWEAIGSWTFLSWRPSNDLLIRAGKLRIPEFLFSESQDVGVTYDFLRLPTEMYSVSPISDFTGVSFSKSWELEGGDLSLDGYWGRANPTVRTYIGQAMFSSIRVESEGLAMTYHTSEAGNTYRIDVHNPLIKPDGVLIFSSTRIPLVNLGTSIGLGYDMRFIGEYLAMYPDSGGVSRGAYISLLRKIGEWTPYAYVAGIKSNGMLLNRSWAIGTSYTLTATSKIKAEWLQSHIGPTANLVDVPLGSDLSNQDVNVFSLS